MIFIAPHTRIRQYRFRLRSYSPDLRGMASTDQRRSWWHPFQDNRIIRVEYEENSLIIYRFVTTGKFNLAGIPERTLKSPNNPLLQVGHHFFNLLLVHIGKCGLRLDFLRPVIGAGDHRS